MGAKGGTWEGSLAARAVGRPLLGEPSIGPTRPRYRRLVPPELRITALTTAHRDAIARVLADDGGYTVRVTGRPADDDDVTALLTEAPADAAPGNHHVLGLWAGDELVGVAALVVDWPEAGVTWLALLLVRADHHGQGLARGFHEALQERFAGTWRLAVVDTNAQVIPFWERLGYARTGETRRWSSGSGAEHEVGVMERGAESRDPSRPPQCEK